MAINFDSLGNAVANAKRGMGAYLSNQSDDQVQAYGQTDAGGMLRATITEVDGHAQIRLQTTDPATDRTLSAPVSDVDEIVSVLMSAVDQHGTLLDVDEFDGDGEKWHDAMDTFTDAADAAFDAPKLSDLGDAGAAPDVEADGPAPEIDH